MKYVFGPLQSRRLGKSLGIGLIPAKTCNMNCIYCEANATTDATNVRREFVPLDEVLKELDEVLAEKPALDSITFSGAGEPTLYSRLGEIVDFLKSRHPAYKTTLLTNGLLLGDKILQKELAKIDLVMPSLDGSCQEEFDAITRPSPRVDFDAVVAGLADFTKQASCPVYLELFIVPGINDSDASIARFAGLLEKIRPARVQLNSLDRPGTETSVRPAPPETIRKFLASLGKIVPTETIRRT